MIIHAYFGLDSIVHKVRYMFFGFTFLVLFSNIAVGYNSDDSSGIEGIVYQQDSFSSVESDFLKEVFSDITEISLDFFFRIP